MGEIDVAGVLLALIAAGAAVLTLVGALHLTTRRGIGFFQYFPYAVLLSLAMLILFAGRTFSANNEMQNGLLAEGNPVSSWAGRLASVFLLMASLERIVNYALRRNRSAIPPHPLLVAFVLFWLTTVASPALFGAHGSFSHDYLYTLLMGSAALLLSKRESDAAVAAARNGLMLFLAISLALIPLLPRLVMDPNYTAGLIPGVPRFAGLAPHAVSLAVLAQLALLCLFAQPFSRRWLNRFCWALGLFALFLAQSKTSWLSFPVCAACIFWMRRDSAPRRRLGLMAVLLVLIGLGLTYLFGNLGVHLGSLFSGQQAADLTSLTGRDRIWAVALGEWARYPTFGYGPDLFNEVYRADIAMPYATNGLNQFIDTLARSGVVGAAGLGLYVTTLFVYSVKQARASRGLSIAVFLAIAFQSVAEVPLQVFRYGPDVLQHFLLLAILAGTAGSLGRSALQATGKLPKPTQQGRHVANAVSLMQRQGHWLGNK